MNILQKVITITMVTGVIVLTMVFSYMYFASSAANSKSSNVAKQKKNRGPIETGITTITENKWTRIPPKGRVPIGGSLVISSENGTVLKNCEDCPKFTRKSEENGSSELSQERIRWVKSLKGGAQKLSWEVHE